MISYGHKVSQREASVGLNVKRSRAVCALFLGFMLTFGAAAQAYYFEGYYIPVLLLSPMRDDIVYTPAGAGVVTSKAGFRVHPVTGRGDFHNGVDLAATLNDKVYNLLDGVVVQSGYRGNLGVAVEVYHPYPNIHTIVGHLNGYTVRPGMWVKRGQVIGFAGSTGRSTGVHVHYTVVTHEPRQYIEPLRYLQAVPQYVGALKTARVRALQAMRADDMRKKQAMKVSSPSDSEDEDLPASGAEVAPPTADK
jgi:hypothetical protein